MTQQPFWFTQAVGFTVGQGRVVPVVRGAQVPVATPVLALEQPMQASPQVVAQQTPSLEQMLLAHWALLEQAPPCLSRQAPAALQVLAPVQVLSSALVTIEQVPVALLQLKQMPAQVEVQQWPSTQLPVVHSVPTVQAVPLALVAAHDPFVPQVRPALQTLPAQHTCPAAPHRHMLAVSHVSVVARHLVVPPQHG